MNGVSTHTSSPVNDPKRVATLRHTGLLNTQPEAVFDRLIQLAVRVLGVPMAVLTLVDSQRQVLKSSFGLPQAWHSQQHLPVDFLRGREVVDSGAPLLITDIRSDSGVRADLNIPDATVLACAGIPITIAQKHVLGVFYVLDSEPRAWSARELATLTDVAAIAAREMECRIESVDSRETAARLTSLVETAVEGIIVIDAQGSVEAFNPAAERLFGYAAQEVLGKNVHILMPAPYHQAHDQYIHNYLTTGVKKIIGIGREVVGRRKDGSTFPIELAVSEMCFNGVPKFTGIVRDISERKRTEAALYRSNRDLQDFAYIASHDLREPLRTVTSYLELLQRRYADRLDDNARDFIAFAVDGARRMVALVEGLLTYSRLETHAQEPEIVDLESVLIEVIHDLRSSIADSNAQITHDPLPSVQVDGVQCRQLLQNLISNALKFRSQAPPRVHLSAHADDGEWVVAVRDNGIGIDMKFQQRIFKIFQRLHTRDEYPGIGLGLAICQRIVERQGGRIWVESLPGAGAKFCFTLPVATPEVSTNDSPISH